MMGWELQDIDITRDGIWNHYQRQSKCLELIFFVAGLFHASRCLAWGVASPRSVQSSAELLKITLQSLQDLSVSGIIAAQN